MLPLLALRDIGADVKETYLALVGLGIISHLGYFIHGEHHLQAPTLLIASIIMPIAIFLAISYFESQGIAQAAVRTALIGTSYLTGLWLSIITYRLFFHRLRSFPGPRMARVSKLWHAWLLYPKMKNYLHLEAWRKQYGDFVRTGPSEIAIFHPDAMPVLLGPKSKCTKAPWYDVTLPMVSMQSTRDKAAHDRRRRVWDRGFNTKALLSYESRVLGYVKTMVSQISASAGGAMNATKWANLYALDVMGDFAFGKNFGMVESGKEHHALGLVHTSMMPYGILSPIPWAFIIMAKLPFSTPFSRFLSWSNQEIREREQMKPTEADVMSHLIEYSAEIRDLAERNNWLSGDARLIIIAGSDTTAATLACALYYLAAHPAEASKLRDEVKSLVPPGSDITFRDVQDGDHLNGIINETLRLNHPVPSGLYRVTPKEGITIGGTFIPGNTTVVAPNFSMGRNESAYERPEEFIPERWYSKPELVKNKNAFAPFSIGPYSCVGKQLALMELRFALIEIISKFDISFAPGEDGKAIMRDAVDVFTVAMGDMNLSFTPVGEAK